MVKFKLRKEIKYRADDSQETIDRRQEGLWSNVYSPKSLAENSISGLGIRNSAKATAPKCEMQATSYAYHYFLNGHWDVIATLTLATSFADANFTPEQIESYEYTPWGLLLTSANKNNLLYTSREFDFEINAYFNEYEIYFPFTGFYYLFIKSLKINKEVEKLKIFDVFEIILAYYFPFENQKYYYAGGGGSGHCAITFGCSDGGTGYIACVADSGCTCKCIRRGGGCAVTFENCKGYSIITIMCC